MTTCGAQTWTHHNPVRVVASDNALDMLTSLTSEGGRWLLLTTPGSTRRGVTDRICRLFNAQSQQRRLQVYDGIRPNPELDELDGITAQFANDDLAGIIALGGGSVLDAGKILSVVLASADERPLHQCLREGQGQNWNNSLPMIAIPTTAGTGSEVTPFATVWDHATQRKHSVAGDRVFPDYCLLDPALTLSLPCDETLYTGLDAVSHALESLWNQHCTPVSEALALKALELINCALPRVLRTPDDLTQRRHMQNASLLAGMAISQTRTAIAHSISYPLTLHYAMPHGLACSFTLPSILRDHLDELSDSAMKQQVLENTLALLDSIDFHEHVSRYAHRTDVMRLQPEMLTSNRADNFRFRNNLARTLDVSLR